MTKPYVGVKIVLKEGAIAPSYETSGAAGADIKAYLPEGEFNLKAGKYAMIPTGMSVEIPSGYELQVRPRSGLAAKYGVTVLNAPGTIDSDYRGEVKVILINLSENDFIIKNGDRIAQFVLAPAYQAEFVKAEYLSESARGQGGFGSTGIK